MATTRLPAILDGALLVRVTAGEPDWWTGLPPTPPGWGLTLTLPGAGDERERSALAARGYRAVPGPTSSAPARTADVLVPEELRELEGPWWRALLLVAERVFDPRLGPVLAVLGPVLQRHLDALADGS
jgi:hypothetical protein